MQGPPDSEQLEAVRELDGVLEKLQRLVLKCASNERITGRDETRYSNLLGQAQELHGRVHKLLGVMIKNQAGRRWDVFQSVLGQRSIASLLLPYSTVEFWREDLSSARSLVKQAVGRLEEAQRQGRLGLAPEIVSRYRRLIVGLEATRRVVAAAMRWISTPLHILDPLFQRIERSLPVRVVLLVGGVGGGVALVWRFVL